MTTSAIATATANTASPQVANAPAPANSSLSRPAGEGWGEGASEAAQPTTATSPQQPTSTSNTAAAISPNTSTPAQPRKTFTTAPQKTSTASAVGSTVFALLLIVGLILALAWLARRMPGVGGTSNGALKIVGSLALSPKERVVVVDVGGQQVLLSTGQGGTRLLQALETPLPVNAAPQPFKPFAQVLAQQFGRKA